MHVQGLQLQGHVSKIMFNARQGILDGRGRKPGAQANASHTVTATAAADKTAAVRCLSPLRLCLPTCDRLCLHEHSPCWAAGACSTAQQAQGAATTMTHDQSLTWQDCKCCDESARHKEVDAAIGLLAHLSL